MSGLRTAEAADAGRVVALVESAYRGEESRAGWTTEADLLDGQRTDAAEVTLAITEPGHVMLLLTEDTDELLACCALTRRGTRAHFGMFAVRPTRQAAGLGRGLLGAAEAWASETWNSQVMDMTVISLRIELISWYARRGYAPTGTREPFPYGDERFGLPRRDDLAFVVLAKSL